jgi:hypothetical protein
MSNEEEQIISCAKCGNTPDDVLILTCDHNLCLQCAAKNLKREQAKGNTSYQTIICDICNAPTALDPASASELLGSASIPQTEEIEKPEIEEPIYETKSKKSIINEKPEPKYDQRYCKEHPDEDIKYFCFECLSAPVCSECVIHGNHKNHEVMNIKKAYPVVKEKMEDIVTKIVSKIDELNAQEANIEHKY